MSKLLHFKEDLIGGAADSLDSIDGAGLSDGDIAMVFSGTSIYHYRLNATSGATESSPYIVSPDTNAGTKRWVLQGIPWKTDAGDVFFHSNLVNNPQRLSWHVGAETAIGPGYRATDAYSADRLLLSPLSGSTAWANIANAGAAAQVVTDDTYATILNITSGAGVVTNLILPGVTAASDIVSLKITIDGTEHVLTFTAGSATDRFMAGIVKALHSYYQSGTGYTGFYAGSWTGIDIVSSLAVRHESSVDSILFRPDEVLSMGQCIRFADSLKVEMKSSDVSTTNYRDYCGVAYLLDQ